MNQSTRFVAEAGIMLALAFVLSYLKIFEMPQGGSVTLGSMLPILFIALRWGLVRGLVAGFVFGLLQMQFGGYVIGLVQGALDYPIAFGALGFAGLAAPFLNKSLSTKSVIIAVGASALGVLLRYACHVASGVIFFAEYAGDKDPLIHSMQYNAFLAPDFGIALALLAVLWVPLNRMIPKAGK